MYHEICKRHDYWKVLKIGTENKTHSRPRSHFKNVTGSFKAKSINITYSVVYVH